jgi:hypothetical protein
MLLYYFERAARIQLADAGRERRPAPACHPRRTKSARKRRASSGRAGRHPARRRTRMAGLLRQLDQPKARFRRLPLLNFPRSPSITRNRRVSMLKPTFDAHRFWRRPPSLTSIGPAAAGADQGAGEGQPAPEVAAAGAVRRLLRGAGQGLLQGRGHRPHHQSRRPEPADREPGRDRRRHLRPVRRHRQRVRRRDKGLPIVSSAWPTRSRRSCSSSRKDGPIKSLKDFEGKKVTAWFTGANYVLLRHAGQAGIDPKEANIQPQQVSVTPFVDKQVDVVTATRYNEFYVINSASVRKTCNLRA